MNTCCARYLAPVLLAGSLVTLPGCRRDGMQGSGSGALADISEPATFNEMYQTRNPRKCAEVMVPPTVAQATALIQCSTESDTTGSSTPLITLVTDLKVEMDPPRDYMAGVDSSPDIDARAKIYPLHGQGTMWRCSPAAQYGPGQNCVSYSAAPGSQGSCHKTGFGDWTCGLTTGSAHKELKLKGPTTY